MILYRHTYRSFFSIQSHSLSIHQHKHQLYLFEQKSETLNKFGLQILGLTLILSPQFRQGILRILAGTDDLTS